MAASFRHEGDRLSAFLDDELANDDALEVARHLDGCTACREELDALRETRSALRSLPSATPSLSWMVETSLIGHSAPEAVHSARAIAAAGAGIVLLVAAAWLLGGESGSVAPPVESLVVDHVQSVEGGPVVVPVLLEDPGTG